VSVRPVGSAPDQVTLDQVTLDQVTLDQVTLDQVTLDRIVFEWVVCDRPALDLLGGAQEKLATWPSLSRMR
jgi:hypothetical protein